MCSGSLELSVHASDQYLPGTRAKTLYVAINREGLERTPLWRIFKRVGVVIFRGGSFFISTNDEKDRLTRFISLMCTNAATSSLFLSLFQNFSLFAMTNLHSTFRCETIFAEKLFDTLVLARFHRRNAGRGLRSARWPVRRRISRSAGATG